MPPCGLHGAPVGESAAAPMKTARQNRSCTSDGGMTNSLFEGLKNLRFSYRLLLSIYSALLVFVVSPDARKPLEQARAELAAFLEPKSVFAEDLKHFHEHRSAAWSHLEWHREQFRGNAPAWARGSVR